jgi:hypothetical protein
MKTVRATVPGNCELDLVKAGVLPQPELGMNVLKLRPYEGYQWLYTKVFHKPDVKAGQRAMLTFEGIDTLADVFLNGVKIGETSNMLIPHAFNVTKVLKEGENKVQVLIRSVMCEAQYMTIGELGYSMGDSFADAERFRKAGHMGGWDIFPRAFVSGLWRDVSIEIQDPVRIDQTAWIVKSLDVRRKSADLMVTCRVQAPFRHIGKANIKYAVSREGKVYAEFINRLDPTLYTNQPLYRDTVGLYEVIPYKHKVRLAAKAELALYGDRLTMTRDGETEEIPFDDIRAVAVLGRNKLNMYRQDRIFQIKGDKRFNALKYIHFYHRYKNYRNGDIYDQFLGI